MASFEPYLKSDARFRAHTMPELGVPKADNERNFFVSQLDMTAGETYVVLLRDPPAPQLLRINNKGQIDVHSQSLDSFFTVTSDNQKVANIKFKFNYAMGQVYEIAANAKLSGVALIQAKAVLNGTSLASLRVTVVPKAAEPVQPRQAGPPRDVDWLARLGEFYSGFKEGLAVHTQDSAKILLLKLTTSARVFPAGEKAFDAAMNAAFFNGMKKGLEESVTGFIDMLKGVGKFVFDAKFRDELSHQANELLQPLMEEFLASRGDLTKFIGPIVNNAKAVGRSVGDEVGAALNQKLATMSPLDLADFAGRILGIAAFELITFIITELIGLGAIQALRWIDEGGGVVAKLSVRLKAIFTASEELKVALRTKFGKVVKTAEEAEVGGMAGRRSPKDLPKDHPGRFADDHGSKGLDRSHKAAVANAARKRFLDGATVVPRKFNAKEVNTITEEIAKTMKRLGIPPNNIGINGVADETGQAFTAAGRTRGANSPGRGISVHGSTWSKWDGFDEWNAIEAGQEHIKIEAVIAHEWHEFKYGSLYDLDVAHRQSVQLANNTDLPISPEARKLLLAMRRRFQIDTVYIPPPPYTP